MKKNYLLLLALCFFTSLNAQIINIPDANFKAKLLEENIGNSIAFDQKGNRIVIDVNHDGEIQLSEALNVYNLSLNKSNISSLVGIKSFSNLTLLYCGENQISELDVSGLNLLNVLVCKKNKLSNLNLFGCVDLLNIDCSENQLSTLNLQECNKLTSLLCQDNPLADLNVTASSSLTTLDFSRTHLSNFEVKQFLNLEVLYCSDSDLDMLDLRGLIKLEQLLCSYNNLASLDFTDLVNLKQLVCRDNLLKNLNISNLINLELLDFGNDQLDFVDLPVSSSLAFVGLYNSSLTSIDFSKLKGLDVLWVIDNSKLESILIKNGSIENNIIVTGNEMLKYVCVDEEQILQIQSSLNDSNQLNVNINSFCSFVSGGENYQIVGKNRVDLNTDGCDSLDALASIRFNITNGIISDTTDGNVDRSIGNNLEDYSIKIPAGNYKIMPVLENPNYFTVFPVFSQVEFPAITSPFVQDFCITPLGAHIDLEIVFIPLIPARPGFDTKYKVVYKNKGNSVQSGTISFNFDDSVLDLVSSSSSIVNQSINHLVWNFSNLKPLESREIQLVFNVNSPTETPAVNNNDILRYKIEIASNEVDEMPIDNVFELNHNVVGSYDPNDKTCLEGSVIKPELIGEYVHYLIRFENTGTYSAENIVVKDMIDLSKFDISTLITTSASHSFVTKISDKNKVEFIFENINLPFDDANNDGYIAFKIKTLPNLKVGDSFTNEANIYFDYNFPILTNKTLSVFKTTLGTQDFTFDEYFKIYPNPVRDFLNIESKNDMLKESVNVYNVLGQLVLAIPIAGNTTKIDVSKFQSGTYFLQVKSLKGTSAVKFVKI